MQPMNGMTAGQMPRPDLAGVGGGGKGGVGGQVPTGAPQMGAPQPSGLNFPVQDTSLGGAPQMGAPQPSGLNFPVQDTSLGGGGSPFAPQQGFNVNQAAAGGLQQAMQGTQDAMAGPDIGQFQNPYTQQVTDATLNGMERQRQMQMNNMGASATAAGAFGGSRHGVAEGATNEGFARQGAEALGRLNYQGFNTALGAAQNQQGMMMTGAGQLGNLGNQAFNTSQAIGNNQAQQGLMQQGMQQALIDRAQNQFSQYQQAPNAALGTNLAALGAAQTGAQTTTQSNNPGVMDYLSLGAGLFASDPRLKENIVKLETRGGVNIYRWDWNELGRDIASPALSGTGVMADELELSHPHLVERGRDGYLRVNYEGLNKELDLEFEIGG